MDQEIHHCGEIASKPLSFFFQEGSNDRGKKILIVGESLAKNGWVESGKAFYTTTGKLVPTGKRLNEELSIVNMKLEECAFTEIAKCYIGKNRKQLPICGSLCASHFLQQLDQYRPKLILSLGVITKDLLQELFETEFEMGTLKETGNYFVLPLYHPSPANPFGHGKNLKIISEQKESIAKIIK